MDDVVVLQTGPEDFRVLLGGGQHVAVTVERATAAAVG
jgi:hypothetical protein